MKPAAFRYAAPRTMDEALDLVGAYGYEAKVLAGGQSLVPLLHLRLARPELVIDLNKIPGEGEIEVRDGFLRVGMLVRQTRAEASHLVRERAPMLAEAVRQIAHPQIRSRGTLCGSVAHADPAAEIPAVLLALDGEVVAQSEDGSRTIAARDFFQGFYLTALEPNEILTEARFHLLPAGSGSAFVEFSRRPGDFALVGVAAALEISVEGTVRSARIALCGVGDAPLRSDAAEELVSGEVFSREVARDAGRVAAEVLDPPDDVQASSGYRRQLTQVLVERALCLAAQRAGWEADR